MTIQQTVDIVLKSSDHNPYTGMLSKEEHMVAAVALAKLAKDFADKGMKDEAMNLDSEHWSEVISQLELKSNKV